MLIETQVLDILKACYDLANPYGKPANIVELGCIDNMELLPDSQAPGAGIPGVPQKFELNLTIAPSSQEEDARAQLNAQILNGLAGLENLSRTHLTFAEGWTAQRVTPEGRRRLKLDPAPFAILNNRR